jgi:hypothetical protein
MNVVVSLFQLVVRPTMNLSKKAPAVVGPSAGIETQKVGFVFHCVPARITCLWRMKT